MFKTIVYIGAGSCIGGSPEMKAFLTVGLCGGFTTFSTFVHENYILFNSSQSLTLTLYAVASFGLGLLCAHAGHFIARTI